MIGAPSSPLPPPSNSTGNGSPATASKQHVEILPLLRRLESDDPDDAVVVRFFCAAGDFELTEVFGKSAERVCELLFRTETALRTCFDGRTPYLPLTSGQLTLALRELVLNASNEQQCYVELHAKGNSGGALEWRCERKASAGCLDAIEDLMLRDDEDSTLSSTSMTTPVIAGVMITAGDMAAYQVTLVFIDHTSIGHCTFADNELLLTTEVVLAQVACRQLLYPATTSHDKLRELLQLNGILGTPTPLKQFDAQVGCLDFCRLVIPDLALPASLLSPQVQAIGAALFSYLQIFRLDGNLATFTLQHYDSRAFMRLDESALRGMNVFVSLTANASSPSSASHPSPSYSCSGTQRGALRWQSLHGLLSQHCRTAQGIRQVAQWLRQPLLDLDDIHQRLDIVQSLVELTEVRVRLQDPLLKGLNDLARINRKLQRDRASLQDLAVLHDFLGRCRLISDVLDQLENPSARALLGEPLRLLLGECQALEDLLRTSLDFEAMARHEYLVKAQFDPALGALAEQKSAVLAQIEREAAQVADALDLDLGRKLKLESNPGTYGHYLRVSRLDGKALDVLRRDDPTFSELAVLKSGVLFQTKRMRVLSADYGDLTTQYITRQSSIVKDLRRTVSTYHLMLERLNVLIAMVDAFTALAQAALTAPIKPWVRPIVSSGTGVNIVGGRHPLLEAKLCEDGNVVVCNDTTLTNDLRFGIITGPNMGGKSTYLRQTGLLALMAQVGSFVPADWAELPVFDAVLLRVGAGDDLFKGVSTFLAEMLQVTSILGSLSDRSLVLVDELGRGTSCEEGAAVAKSIAEYLAGHSMCKCLFATHFHELARDLEPGMHCLHVDGEHRIHPGSTEVGSLGIQLAAQMGFPVDFIRDARSFYDSLSGK
jgi:DNA mismatch repair protein MSH2